MKILLIVRTRAVAEEVITALRAFEVEMSAATSAEEVAAALREATPDHVILGGGLDLDTRLRIARIVFEASDATTVHMNSPSGPESYLPFVRSVVHGLLDGERTLSQESRA